MKSLLNRIAIILVLTTSITSLPAYCENDGEGGTGITNGSNDISTTLVTQDEQEQTDSVLADDDITKSNASFDNKDNKDVIDIEPTANNLEKALMKYVLTYEAYQKAKLTPSQQSNLPEFKKKYDEAYSTYLILLEKADLYDPDDEEKPNDPAGLYNDKVVAQGKDYQLWETVDTSAVREKISEAVGNGKDPDSVTDLVNDQIPENGYSKAEVDKDDDEEDDDGDDDSTMKFNAGSKCSHERGHRPHHCRKHYGICKKCGLQW